jgi:hypothetical protein
MGSCWADEIRFVRLSQRIIRKNGDNKNLRSAILDKIKMGVAFYNAYQALPFGGDYQAAASEQPLF